MRVPLVILLGLVLLSVCTVSLAQTAETHDVILDTDVDHEIAQPTRAPGTPTRPDSGMGTSPTPRPTRSRIPRTTRRPDMLPISRRMTDRARQTTPRDPDTSGRMTRLTMMERRMLMRMFRDLLRLRLRMMTDEYPFGIPHWERRMLRMMMLRDMMMMMDVQADDANEIAQMIDEQDQMENVNNDNTYDETETAEPEVETEAVEPEIEVADVEEHEVSDPRDDPRLIDPTLVEAEFDISAPYGGYGGFGYGGGYGGGFGGKKGGFGYGGGFGGKKGGYGGGFGGKKVPYKKVPYKKVPYKKVPIKKGGFGGYGGGFI